MSNYGAYVNGRRPASKRAINVAIAEGGKVRFDCTAMMGDTTDLAVIDGKVVRDDNGQPYTGRASIVGPDPYTKRMFYGTLTVNAKTGKVTVK